MPHLDSSTIRPLYDVHDGGPPVGFRCRLSQHDISRNLDKRAFDLEHDAVEYPCGRVTRTLAGMRTHQRIVHGIKLQQEFQFETVLPTREDRDL